MMNETQVQLVKALADRSPELAGLLDEHPADHKAEIPSHVLMGDVTRWLTRIASYPGRRSEVRDILEFLDAEFERGDEGVRELISVSFLENLPQAGERDAILWNALARI
jgi:hypothetical protein